MADVGDMYSDEEDAKKELTEEEYKVYMEARNEIEEESTPGEESVKQRLQEIVDESVREHIRIERARKKYDPNLLQKMAKTKGKKNFEVTS